MARFREAVERRVGPAAHGRRGQAVHSVADHLGIFSQKQTGLNYVGLRPGGPHHGDQLLELARLAERVRQRRDPSDDRPERDHPQRARREARPRSPPSPCCGNSVTIRRAWSAAWSAAPASTTATSRRRNQGAAPSRPPRRSSERAGRQAVDDALVGLSGGMRQPRGRRYRAARQERQIDGEDRRRRRRLRRRQVGAGCKPGMKILEDVPCDALPRSAGGADSPRGLRQASETDAVFGPPPSPRRRPRGAGRRLPRDPAGGDRGREREA